MAYPQTPLPVVVEFWNGTSWVDITGKTFVRDGGIDIRRGFPDEGTTPEPSECRMTLDNRTGDFTPRNPMGQYYGLIGRNTPVRVRVGDGLAGDGWFRVNLAEITSRAFSLDAAALDITGDIDIRVDAALDAWASGAALATKYLVSGDNRSWAFLIDTSGDLTFGWSPDGTSGSIISATSTVPASVTNSQRKALRVTLDVDNGASGWTVTFYTADTIGGSWVQLGDPVTDSGVTSIFSGTGNLHVGNSTEFSAFAQTGKLYGFELRSGIDGTEVANPDFTALEPRTTFFTDDAGRDWLLEDGYITGPATRFIGEVSEWPTRWDVSEQDVWTEVMAQGILRRLGQGSRPVRSPLKSAIMLAGGVNQDFLAAYWPMEDGGSGTSVRFASAVAGGSSMTYSGTAPDVGPELGIGPLLGSDRIPVLAATTTLSGQVPAATDGAIVTSCIMDVPTTTGWSDNTPILWVNQSTSGSTVATWEVRYKSGSGGDLQVRALDSAGVELAASGTLDFNIDGQQLWLGFNVVEDGSDADWTLYIRTVADDGVTVDSATTSSTFSGLAVTHATQVQIAPSGGLAELAVGHVAVSHFETFGNYYSADSLELGLVANAGETAVDRAHRLAAEIFADVNAPFRAIGATNTPASDDATTLMGAQAIPSTFSDAYNETWAADLALAYETRDALGLSWRSRASLYNQPVALTLDYTAAGEIAPDLEPIDDDQRTRNDIEVKRKNGSSARAVDSTSRMGTQDPPDGVGRYEHSVTLNLYDDAVLVDYANWLLHLGTWDEARYPRIRVDMAALAAQGKTSLIAQVCALDVGDRIRLTNLPAFSGTPGTVDLLVLGFEERIGHPVEWTVVLNCVPYGPWDIGTYVATPIDETTKRYDTLHSTVDGALVLPGSAGDYASTPHSADLGITGDIDVRVDCALTDWTPAAAQCLAAKWSGTAGSLSWQFLVETSGLLTFRISTDGTATSAASSSVAPTAVNGGRLAVRVTLDVDDGGGNRVFTFYTAPDMDGTWTQLGTVQTFAGTTSIFNATTTPVTVGAFSNGGSPAAGRFYAAQVRSSIGGTQRANPIFSTQGDGDTSFADAAGNTWTVNGSAAIDTAWVAGTDTTLRVNINAGGTLWTTKSSSFTGLRIEAGGAIWAVSSISGTATPQTITVTQTPVNGVVKSVTAGTQVRVAPPQRATRGL